MVCRKSVSAGLELVATSQKRASTCVHRRAPKKTSTVTKAVSGIDEARG